jgi:hypothetical protein
MIVWQFALWLVIGCLAQEIMEFIWPRTEDDR